MIDFDRVARIAARMKAVWKDAPGGLDYDVADDSLSAAPGYQRAPEDTRARQVMDGAGGARSFKYMPALYQAYADLPPDNDVRKEAEMWEAVYKALPNLVNVVKADRQKLFRARGWETEDMQPLYAELDTAFTEFKQAVPNWNNDDLADALPTLENLGECIDHLGMAADNPSAKFNENPYLSAAQDSMNEVNLENEYRGMSNSIMDDMQQDIHSELIKLGIGNEKSVRTAKALPDAYQQQLDCANKLSGQVRDMQQYRPDGDTITDRAEDWLYNIQGTLNPTYADYGLENPDDTGFSIVWKYFKSGCQLEPDIEAEYKGRLDTGTCFDRISGYLDNMERFLSKRIGELENMTGKSTKYRPAPTTDWNTIIDTNPMDTENYIGAEMEADSDSSPDSVVNPPPTRTMRMTHNAPELRAARRLSHSGLNASRAALKEAAVDALKQWVDEQLDHYGEDVPVSEVATSQFENLMRGLQAIYGDTLWNAYDTGMHLGDFDVLLDDFDAGDAEELAMATSDKSMKAYLGRMRALKMGRSAAKSNTLYQNGGNSGDFTWTMDVQEEDGIVDAEVAIRMSRSNSEIKVGTFMATSAFAEDPQKAMDAFKSRLSKAVGSLGDLADDLTNEVNHINFTIPTQPSTQSYRSYTRATKGEVTRQDFADVAQLLYDEMSSLDKISEKWGDLAAEYRTYSGNPDVQMSEIMSPDEQEQIVSIMKQMRDMTNWLRGGIVMQMHDLATTLQRPYTPATASYRSHAKYEGQPPNADLIAGETLLPPTDVNLVIDQDGAVIGDAETLKAALRLKVQQELRRRNLA